MRRGEGMGGRGLREGGGTGGEKVMVDCCFSLGIFEDFCLDDVSMTWDCYFCDEELNQGRKKIK